MIIYKDCITGDELTSDTYTIKEVEGQPLLWKVTGRTMTKNADKIDDSMFGGNASAEAAPEEMEDGGSKQVIDIIDGPRLESIPALRKNGLKQFKAEMKSFLKGVAKYLESQGEKEKLDEFMGGANGALKFLYGQLEDLEIYVGESRNAEGGWGWLNYEEDGVTPYLLFFKHALVEEKC